MTDRIGGLLIVLEEPLRDDSRGLEALEGAMRQLHGVVAVERVQPSSNLSELQAALRVEQRWRERVIRHAEQMIEEGGES